MAKQGEWVSFSTTLPFSAIRCLKGAQCRQSCCSQKPPSERIAQYFETESGNGDSDTLDHVQYRLDCLYRLILGCFDAGIVDQRVHSSFHFSLGLQTLYFPFKVCWGNMIKKNKTTSCSQYDRQKFMCPCFLRLENTEACLPLLFGGLAIWFLLCGAGRRVLTGLSSYALKSARRFEAILSLLFWLGMDLYY